MSRRCVKFWWTGSGVTLSPGMCSSEVAKRQPNVILVNFGILGKALNRGGKPDLYPPYASALQWKGQCPQDPSTSLQWVCDVLKPSVTKLMVYQVAEINTPWTCVRNIEVVSVLFGWELCSRLPRNETSEDGLLALELAGFIFRVYPMENTFLVLNTKCSISHPNWSTGPEKQTMLVEKALGIVVGINRWLPTSRTRERM